MSQVAFRRRNLEVVAGYDNGEFFLDVFDSNFFVVWSNLTDFETVDRHSTSRLKQQLEVLKIPAPEGFWEIVESGENRDVRFDWTGSSWSKSRKQRPIAS